MCDEHIPQIAEITKIFRNIDCLIVVTRTLLLYQGHYFYISSLSRLLSEQMSDHNGAIFHCRLCLKSFNALETKKNHENDCLNFMKNGGAILKTPKIIKNKNNEDIIPTTKFKHNSYQVPRRQLIHADFETLQKKINDTKSEHKCLSFAIKEVGIYNKSYEYCATMNEDEVLDEFFDILIKEGKNK